MTSSAAIQVESRARDSICDGPSTSWDARERSSGRDAEAETHGMSAVALKDVLADLMRAGQNQERQRANPGWGIVQ